MPKTKADPAQSAYDAAEMIRKLNHETLNGPALSAPEISRAVRHLVDLVDRLPQTFEQLAGLLDRQQTAGLVRMEDGSDPAAPVAVVAMRLEQCAALTESANRERYGAPASPLATALQDASGRLFAMGGVITDGED